MAEWNPWQEMERVRREIDREMKTRFPDATARAPLPPQTVKDEPVHTGSLPEIVGLRRIEPRR